LKTGDVGFHGDRLKDAEGGHLGATVYLGPGGFDHDGFTVAEVADVDEPAAVRRVHMGNLD